MNVKHNVIRSHVTSQKEHNGNYVQSDIGHCLKKLHRFFTQNNMRYCY